MPEYRAKDEFLNLRWAIGLLNDLTYDIVGSNYDKACAKAKGASKHMLPHLLVAREEDPLLGKCKDFRNYVKKIEDYEKLNCAKSKDLLKFVDALFYGVFQYLMSFDKKGIKQWKESKKRAFSFQFADRAFRDEVSKEMGYYFEIVNDLKKKMP
ncbi:MAG: hypothetical protein EAX95_05445 [Candidatus Thorarchaeota archaeon]|nr:hypothetical protein [Candidatus Thorarchaeota archaeon]